MHSTSPEKYSPDDDRGMARSASPPARRPAYPRPRQLSPAGPPEAGSSTPETSCAFFSSSVAYLELQQIS